MKPNLRIIHHLAKSGGTIISRCVGCMQGVALLSEVHPLDNEYLGVILPPLCQAYYWLNLLTDKEFASLESQEVIPFHEAITLIYTRASAKQQTLVLRDWNHLDFFGYPFCLPTGELATNQSLSPQFNLLEIATIRHPIDQWFSMKNTIALTEIDLDYYLNGYWQFLQSCGKTMLMIRYEDFCQAPQVVMKQICQHLDLIYDEGFTDKWINYQKITGCLNYFKQDAITAKVYPHSPEILDCFKKNPLYQDILHWTGYSSGVRPVEVA